MSVRESADANKVTNNSTKNINEKKDVYKYSSPSMG